MRVQLIVVQGKPEGKVIPLVVPVFKIGRGERCHLRPNSEQVSREHAEFQITPDQVTIRDLGSRNGTLVNGKPLTEPVRLKDRDLVQIGPLTFAVSIQDAPMATKATSKPRKLASPDEVAAEEIESWLIADNTNPTPDRPSGVYAGETITITSEGDNPPKPPAAPAPAPIEESEDIFDKLDEEEESEKSLESPAEAMPEELIDESNPFHAKKNQPASAKPAARDTSDAALEILRKLMERRRGSK